MIPNFDIEIKQGDTWQTENITWLRGSTPVDLTNLTGKCQIRTVPGAAGVIATATVTTITAIDGIFQLSLTATQTAAIPAGGSSGFVATDYYYDVQFSGAGNYVETILQGKIIVYPEVSK